MSNELSGGPTGDLAGEIQDAVAKALVDCGLADTWRRYVGPNQTSLVARLEQVTGCQHIGLASSGTAALEMLLTACRLKPGDEVLLSGYDYPATFAAIERAGARPALVDVEEQGWNLSWASLEATVTPACRVLIVSHLHGQLQPIAQLQAWCAARNIWLIQDACQSLGAAIDARPIGQFGDATICSFGGGKTISAGRGGAWGSCNARLAQHARLAAGVGSGAHEMSELQAAVVLAQLPFLARITERCRQYFAQLHAELRRKIPGLGVPWEACLDQTAFYQAGWLLPSVSLEADASLNDPHSQNEPANESRGPGSPLIGPNQSQHAELQRTGIGSGFPGYHRRSMRRCRISAPLQNTSRVAQATVTVHHRAALLDAPLGETLAQILSSSSERR